MFSLITASHNNIELQAVLLTLIPIGGTILVTLIGYLINKRMDINKENNSRKRVIYEEFLTAVTLTQFGDNLTLLINPGDPDPYKEVHCTQLDLIRGYERIKLWGSKGVIESCFNYFGAQIQNAKNSENVTQDEMKEYYYKIIEEMRKDLEMEGFMISSNNIHAVTFSRIDNL